MTVVDPIMKRTKHKPGPKRHTAPKKLPRAPEIMPMPRLEMRARRSSFVRSYLTLIVFIVLLIVSPEIVGQVLLIGYGLLAIIRHLPLQMSFGLAVLFLIISPLFTWLTGSEDNGAVLAGYSFVFLAVGLLQLIIGYRRTLREKDDFAR